MNIKIVALSAVVAFGALGTSAFAATLVNEGTTVGGNFAEVGGFTAVNVSDPNNNWDESLTTPTSQWLWDGQYSNQAGSGGTENGTLEWTFDFDLTGYTLETAAITGFAAMDNFGTISLNGNDIFTLTGNTASNYRALASYGTPFAGYFNEGLNTLMYSVSNNNGPGGFRATLNVQADVAPVPLPAAGFLLMAGLGGLGMMRRKKTS
ncbi:hypothetical protein C1J03_16455 [Sulfitobacter sp. SK012]|uniref:VPLPA-CTERM sorting domain-containing protein n=1 Tax=Sulfitobacter sp. SK012 TaxID=1389005 RepID=UPI000E0C76E6|nr:VPLPA-CTERM sorting domain-containing protein [Sulfitobacter sp. SK012]AXI47457.1 hypothetical protein C1J03_16455 [Sulfitobacter sp. SK012]